MLIKVDEKVWQNVVCVNTSSSLRLKNDNYKQNFDPEEIYSQTIYTKDMPQKIEWLKLYYLVNHKVKYVHKIQNHHVLTQI